MSLMFAQVCRLISQAILNRTVRKALDVDPASARLLIEKIEPRARSNAGLIGWVMVVAGIAIGALGIIEKAEDYSDSMPIAAVSVITGMGILLYTWWVGRSVPDVEQIEAR
ncbi:hypothetical protein [Sphingomonas sp. NPDC079357]|uniref:hypothetical protein n=1 Tax=Sphingomonas sp. NPDC079357 TaxID=3364518 RepID=UPI00384F826C